MDSIQHEYNLQQDKPQQIIEINMSRGSISSIMYPYSYSKIAFYRLVISSKTQRQRLHAQHNFGRCDWPVLELGRV